MRKIIAYPLSAIYYLLFGTSLVVFHVIQWICFNLFGYQAHKKSVDVLSFFLVVNTYVLGTRYKINNLDKLPEGVPLIIAANHQSLYDITTICWFLRKVHPKFISKIELGKGIPSISYNLNHGGSVLIDRKDPKQSLSAIREIALYIEANKRSAVIFPEGTRSKTGKPRPFAENGLKILCKYAPSAYMLPVTINNSWKMTRWGSFPLGIGNKIELTLHDPIPVKEMPFPELFEKTEQSVVRAIRQ
ncbi:1-acyl-sn-glycerol-3-phosphate acyltransferase [Parabacteroides sp. PF5-5]|uniref:lysophospholipid acyltransferase family protein n=1 Tax=unclassified Parabacteroides TaxID=2649774 RepID=UPI0024754576|nr:MULTISPECIES: lysophospholipid acyltransferase family protein [unclassified Parabacteroides]MDH6304378.1 1-acyl-sn-glycerol-3-phosphate acyltransferase [Parabacteroides sp. PH5-39]MDH6315469.1 1-acyl-sn-glycerol-3-phosphate acyltransferase [Parabacteroides sp. PF5-13]MDH6319037.1 1-acyl-sn-glycerol-3-phosphate acyltransferase [Parabacteroides sp. PH5-13]MDH6322767.1 1-acyl-sn-glycerol-3-phosphate acyltransferase [Parabacteroides sp. PH5-8]MDH6326661.1 1-acyl-sn-glycerol-3-phosphate acyltran